MTRRRHALPVLVALLTTIFISACGADEDTDQTTAMPASSPTSSPASGDRDAGTSDGTQIRIAFGDSELTGRLHDNATARDLANHLPLTLTIRDHNGVEKTASLPRELSLDGAPVGHDPAAGEIGYWAPGGDFVLYYDDGAPHFDGIVRIGEFDGDLDALERQDNEVEISIEHRRE